MDETTVHTIFYAVLQGLKLMTVNVSFQINFDRMNITCDDEWETERVLKVNVNFVSQFVNSPFSCVLMIGKYITD